MKIIKHSEKLDDLHKRLIQSQYMGISIQYMDGHRWIEVLDDNESFLFKNIMDHARISYNDKVYGSLFDALNYIDYLLEKAGHPSLLDSYNYSNPESEEVDDYTWAIKLHEQYEMKYEDEKGFDERTTVTNKKDHIGQKIWEARYELSQFTNEQMVKQNIERLEAKISELQDEIEKI